MKKVVIFGGAGSIGLSLIKYLLSEGKYEITIVDLKNKETIKRLKRYKKRVNIIYSDCFDRGLIDFLIKTHDYVINLASCILPLANYKEDLANKIEYGVTENIIKAITYYNPNCTLIYGSSTSIFENLDTYYNKAKIKTEKLVTSKCKNYVIVRFPLVLCDLTCEPFIYTVKKDNLVSCITKEDGAYAVCKILDNLDKVNKKEINLGNIECKYEDILNNILKYHGLSFNYILSRIFLSKDMSFPILNDSKKYEKILGYSSDSLDSYFMRQKRRSRYRKINILLGKFILLIKKGR